MDNLVLRRFDKKQKKSMDPASSILVVGSRRAGKTYYSKYLVKKIKKKYSLIILFTHTKESGQWDKIVKPEFQFSKYKPEIIEAIYKRNKEMKEEHPEVNRNCLVIFDDIIDNNTLRHDEMLNSLFIRGRHSSIGIIFLTQYLNALSPTMRANADIVIVPIQSSLKAFEILHDSYGLLPLQQFINLINNYTKNYSVFVIRNDLRSNDPATKYQWDRAKTKHR
jgi:hypothetical protein